VTTEELERRRRELAEWEREKAQAQGARKELLRRLRKDFGLDAATAEEVKRAWEEADARAKRLEAEGARAADEYERRYAKWLRQKG
jgi:hypothetical protein